MNYIKVTVVAFELEENTLLHTYNFVEKYNVEKKEEIDIKKNNIQSLESYLIGIISFEVSTSVPISIEADITNKFTLSFGSNYETLL